MNVTKRDEESMPVAQAAQHPRSEQELEAREELMRQQFKRDNDTWEQATPVSSILSKLKARLSSRQ